MQMPPFCNFYRRLNRLRPVAPAAARQRPSHATALLHKAVARRQPRFSRRLNSATHSTTGSPDLVAGPCDRYFWPGAQLHRAWRPDWSHLWARADGNVTWRTPAPRREFTLRFRNIANGRPPENRLTLKPDHGPTRVCGHMAYPLRYGSHDENAAAGKQGQRKSPATAQNFAVAAGVCQMRLWGRRSQWGADVGRKWREWSVRRTAIRDHDDTFAAPAGCIRPKGRFCGSMRMGRGGHV